MPGVWGIVLALVEALLNDTPTLIKDVEDLVSKFKGGVPSDNSTDSLAAKIEKETQPLVDRLESK